MHVHIHMYVYMHVCNDWVVISCLNMNNQLGENILRNFIISLWEIQQIQGLEWLHFWMF